MRHLALLSCAGLFLATSALAETLTVYTYDSFASEWGPGPAMKAAFEAECDCTLSFVTAGDGAALLARLRMEGARSQADVILGLDTNLTAAAKATGLLAPHQVNAEYDLPVAWQDDTFVPFDWSHFAMIGRDGGPMPLSFEELATSNAKILIQDPRSSTPGLGLLMWVKAAYGEDAPRIWEALADNILTVTPGWSEAWGLFLEGEADFVLSYSTSPAYTLIVENDASIKALPFTEGHYLQIEVAAALQASDTPALAQRFLAFLVSDTAQALIPETQWMFPVRQTAELHPAWSQMLTPQTSLLLPETEAEALRPIAIEEWRSALSR